jgi:cytoskeletal protein CcmA (bactofilin family)
MLGKKDEQEIGKTGNLNTIIGKGSSFEGTLKVEQSLRVDGRIKGQISTTDSLVIGKEGEIEERLLQRTQLSVVESGQKLMLPGKLY